MYLDPILTVSGLSVSFSQYTKGLRRETLKVIRDLDIELYSGKILAVVGASGSGKSLLANAILNVLPENAQMEGVISYKGKQLSSQDQAALRGKDLVLIPQSVKCLDPLLAVGKQVEISMTDMDKKRGMLGKWFQKYGLSPQVESAYPFELSGGMARKVLLTTAVASKAKVIIADEPTPGLDASSVREVLKDFRQLADAGCAILMITHDIQAALKIADQIAIFYAGTTVEVANVSDFCEGGKDLRHPYTKALYRALPDQAFEPTKGTQPLSHEALMGCLYAPRCHLVTEVCVKNIPEYQEVRGGKVRCYDAT